MSKDNNSPEIAYNNMSKTLDKMGIDLIDGAVTLEVAPRYANSKVYDFRRKYENISDK